MEEKIKHDYWVFKNVNGIEYRGKYIDYGWSYSEFIVEKQKFYNERSFFGFGKLKKVSYWEKLCNSHDTNYKVINKSTFYSVDETEKIFDLCIKLDCKHKERFETETQKRDRIINEIIK